MLADIVLVPRHKIPPHVSIAVVPKTKIFVHRPKPRPIRIAVQPQEPPILSARSLSRPPQERR
jgi:hypothetical protein